MTGRSYDWNWTDHNQLQSVTTGPVPVIRFKDLLVTSHSSSSPKFGQKTGLDRTFKHYPTLHPQYDSTQFLIFSSSRNDLSELDMEITVTTVYMPLSFQLYLNSFSSLYLCYYH